MAFQHRVGVSGVHHELAHPNVQLPASAWSEDQTLHVACAFNNPCRYRVPRELFNDFRRHMGGSANVKLYVGELAYGDRPHDVTDWGCPLDTQLRTQHELWHKENILNRVVQQFPPDWQYGAYCDGDFHFTRHDWALEAVHQLQTYDWVQLFSTYCDLGPRHAAGPTFLGFAFANAHRLDFRGRKMCAGEPYNLKVTVSPTYGEATVPATERGFIGSPGGAWAFRRSAFDAVGGLLDICILGTGDYHMALGLAGHALAHQETLEGTSAYRQAIEAWKQRAAILRGNIGYIDCHAIHHYHGPKSNRGYGWRPKMLEDHGFDPGKDIYRDHQGIYQLTPHKPRLRDDLRAYFRSRNDDASG